MKKILLLITVFSMVFTSCDPLEDIYNDIDGQGNSIVGNAEYTLTDEDYDTLGLNFGSFNSVDDAKAMVPSLLTEMFPVWGNGSSVLVDYNLYIGRAFDLDNYSLTQDDYTASGSSLLGFESTATPGDHLVDIITNQYPSAEEGDYVAAQYYQFTGAAFTITPEVSLDENIDYGTTAGNLTTVSGGSWVRHSGSTPVLYTTENLTMTDYPSSNVGGALSISSSGSEDVNHSFSPIITTKKIYSSALMKLSEVGSGTYFFHLMEQDGSYNFSARTGAKSDGAGKILFGIGATSSSLTYGTTAYDLDTTYLIVTSYEVETGVANLYVLTAVTDTEPATPEATNTNRSGNSGQRIGIRQGGGGPSAIIDGIRVANTWSSIMTNETLADEVIGDKVSNNVDYTYTNGAWELPSVNKYYSVTDADFASMGIDNFGSSTPAEDYLSTFLGIKFPYAVEGDVKDVLYKYVSSSSGAQIRGNQYTFTDGTWTGHESTIESTLQFGHDGSTWLPDNTIAYELVSADYTLIADTYRNVTGYESAVSNLETYGNISTFSWDDAQIDAAINTVLNNNFPGMAEDQKFTVTIYVYDGSSHNITIRYILSGGVYIRNI